MQQIYPAIRPCTPAEVYEGAFLDREHGCVAMNVVTSVDGTAALHGVSKGIGSRMDRLLMRRLRSQADAVLTGAGTLRREAVSPGVSKALQEERVRSGQTPQPLTVVLAGIGDFVLPGKLPELGPDRLIIFMPPASEAHSLASVLEADATVYPSAGGLPRPAEVVRILREHHQVKVLLIEGGPTLYRAFLMDGVMDEIFWTVAPKLILSEHTGMLRPASNVPTQQELRLMTAFEHEGELYLRYAVHGGQRSV